MIRRALVVLATAATAAGAQRAPACAKPNPSAAWMLVQKQTLSEEDGAWKNDSLRKALLTAAGMKSAVVAPQLGWEAPSVIDTTPSDVVNALKALPRGSTWPTRSVVGLAGVRAVFLLTRRDTALARIAVHRMMESGSDEAIMPDIAVLEDRLRILAGRKQVYGTQLAMMNGKLAPLPIEDSVRVDMRRAGANLPPLAWAVCNANSK